MRSKRWTGGIAGAMSLAAMTIGVSLTLAPQPAKADQTWACEVVLCLSNPGGPTQYGACVPPIEQLWSTLASGGSVPTCSQGGVKIGALAGYGSLTIFALSAAGGSAAGGSAAGGSAPGGQVSYYVIAQNSSGQVTARPLSASELQTLQALARIEAAGI